MGALFLVFKGSSILFPIVAIPIQILINNVGGEDNGTSLQYSHLENPMDGGAQQAAVYGVSKSRTRLSNFTFTFHFHALETEMATHSSVPAWRIPGMGEPGGLPSMGSHRVGHDLSNLAAAATMQEGFIVVLICISLISDVEHLFMCFFSHLYIFFGDKSVQIFYPFFDWIVWFFDIELCELFLHFRD